MKGSIMVLDFGTTALKVVLFDRSMNISASLSQEFHYEYPHPGWIEYDPQNYLRIASKLMREALEMSDSFDTLEAISVTGQAETIVAIGHDGETIGKAIVWLDTRAQKEASELANAVSNRELYEKTGLIAHDPILPLSKLSWLKNNEPELYKNTQKFLMLKEFIIYWLTGEYISEYSISSCTGYFDIVKKCWDEKLLKAANIDSSKIPLEIAPPSKSVGQCTNTVSQMLGLKRPATVYNGMLDQCAAAIGCGNITQGIISETTGTCMAIAATLDQPPFHADNPVAVLCHGIKDAYLALPYCPTAGIVLKWVKDNLLHFGDSIEDPYAEIDRVVLERGTVKDNLMVLPHYCGYSAPHNNPDATGVFYGVTLGTDAYDIARAVMEGVAFLLRENIENLENIGIAAKQLISIGGGAKSRYWLQVKSDVINLPIRTIMSDESSALGCALGAALEMGWLTDPQDYLSYVKPKMQFKPDKSMKDYYDSKYALYKAINEQLGFYGNSSLPTVE